ncbi:hypothetical protein COLO4_14193 [Corchorus olitorius]|uniref:TPX2 central domain-containing protein n=1 Tax=Corchorus olitorius TaxID=93759 RepID=A0A1R3JT20_9ROSI|nr:hypothetical protein COLO4_14193 [Corchorus olitorius]
MGDEIESGEKAEEFYSVEEPSEVEECFDFTYEFDAPQRYDFNREETDWEVKEAELWFESVGGYPPSPFVLKLKWRYGIDGNEEFGNSSIDCDDRASGLEACSCSSEDNNPMATTNSKTNSGVKYSPFRSSTLMNPTASYLAKQNRYSRPVHCHQLERRFQKFSTKLDDKSTTSSSVPEVNATKRQKLEVGYLCRVAHLTHQAVFMHKKPKMVQSLDGNSVHAKPKVTVPREPELQTAIRAERRRSRVTVESDESATSRAHSFKALPLNRKIFDSPSWPLPKKSLPQPPEFQAMRLPNYVSTSRKENAGLGSFKSVNPSKDEKCEALNKFKSSSKKISSKGETGVCQNIKKETSPTESKILAERRLPNEPPEELLNKLSLSSEAHFGEKSRAKLSHSEGFKENERGLLPLQCQIMNVAKGNLQRNGRMVSA